MKLDQLFICSLITLFIGIGCSDTVQEIDEATCEQTSEFFLEPDNLTFILPADGDGLLSMCTRKPPEDIDGYFNLDFSKVCFAFNNIKKSIPELDQFCFKEDEFIDLEDYHYQFLGLTINDTEHIYINAFILPQIDSLGTFSNWKRKFIDTCGGGSSFWGALLNLNTGNISNVEYNQSNL